MCVQWFFFLFQPNDNSTNSKNNDKDAAWKKNDETSEMRIEHKLTSAAQNELWHKINENPHNRN